MSKPAILIARAVFTEVIDKLTTHFEVEHNQQDYIFPEIELIQKLQGKVGVLTTASEQISANVLRESPSLRICANMAVGYNNFDLAAMSAARVIATNTPDVLTETTADFGFALLMATARRITEGERFLRSGLWDRWRYDMLTGTDIHGSYLGILGMGRIGQAIAKRGAHGFGMTVAYHNRTRLTANAEAACGAQYVSKEQLLRNADHLVLVLPYSASSHHCIGADELALMKPTANLINIARGGIVDDAALASALRMGSIAAAGLDVFEGEPVVHPELLNLPNVVLTPHIASASVTTRKSMAHLAADNLIAYVMGKKIPSHINADKLYKAA